MDDLSLRIHDKLPFGWAKRLYAWNFKLWNFMLVGASGTLVQWFLFNIFRLCFLFEFVAFVAAVVCACLWNFHWNKNWVFLDNEKKMEVSG